MGRKVMAAWGAAALIAGLAPAAAAEVHLGIGIGGPPVVVQPAPPPVAVHPAPPWAPPPGYAPAYQYYYYPSSQVYFDPGRGLWFWLGAAGWVWGPALPPGFHPGRRYVVLPMFVDQPFAHHPHVHRRYPPHWRGRWR